MNINENVLKSDERVALRLRELYRSFGYGQYKMSTISMLETRIF